VDEIIENEKELSYIGQSNNRILFSESRFNEKASHFFNWYYYIYEKNNGYIYKLKENPAFKSLIYPESAVFVSDNTFITPIINKNANREPISFLYLVVKLDM
jgi:hypothetical protein